MRLIKKRMQPKRSARRDNLNGCFSEEVEGNSKVSSILMMLPHLGSVERAFSPSTYPILPMITDTAVC